MYTAQNLGFDTICVNYSNHSEQESICNPPPSTSGDPDCFYYISEAKFDGSGPCTHWQGAWYVHCGIDQYTNTQYYNYSSDAVLHRVTTMLYYLWCTTDNTGGGYPAGSGNYDTANTQWETYLSLAPGATCSNTNENNVAPAWNKIIMAGFSQGGDMATYTAGLELANGTPIVRAINLSAPPQALVSNGNQTAATYLTGWFPGSTIRNVFGLVSANDGHYKMPQGQNNEGVYQAVWKAMGFIPGSPNYDGEWDLNCTASLNTLCNVQTLQGLSCSANHSDNFVNFALVSPGGGHPDPTYIWNQDIYEIMLLGN
jgi:hypothetical protein